MGDPCLVILAAGMGSRFGGLKQITAVDDHGHAIIDFSLYDAWQAGFRKVVFIIKHAIEADFRAAVADRMAKYFDVRLVFQELDKLPEGGRYYDDGDVLRFAGLSFEILATPGHTPGGVSIICEDALFTGDTLFRGSCGRTDLPGGDMDEELRSLKKLCDLPGDYEVYPGHMDSSSLERERNFNYYCREAKRRF